MECGGCVERVMRSREWGLGTEEHSYKVVDWTRCITRMEELNRVIEMWIAGWVKEDGTWKNDVCK